MEVEDDADLEYDLEQQVNDTSTQLRTLSGRVQRKLRTLKQRLLASEAALQASSTSVSLPTVDASSVTGRALVAVLIDGDGCIFDPSHLAKGKSGGGEAAKRLISDLKQRFEYGSARLVVMVFHNLGTIPVPPEEQG